MKNIDSEYNFDDIVFIHLKCYLIPILLILYRYINLD